MGQVLVRNLDESVIARLKMKAELKGHSLEQELRDIINRAAPLTPEERVAFADSIRAQNTGPSRPLSKDEIREGLE